MKTIGRLLGIALSLFLVHVAWGQPFGLTHRVPNTTLQFPPALPVFGYTTNNALGNLTFTAPVAIVSPPEETNRLFIVEQAGRIVVITNLANPTRTVFMDLSGRLVFDGEQGLLGLAFHPGYATNRYFFVFYTTLAPGTLHDRLARFEVSPDNPNQGLTTTEVVLISQTDNYVNHNAGDLHFGPDGYLYVSLGDEGSFNDTGANSQRIDKDFFSAVMRLDVDQRPGSLAPTPHPAVNPGTYRIPPDNPFVEATLFNGIPLTGNVRTEFWAVGLRNPWRFSIDAVTGVLYCGDVGQGQREEIDVIVRGGNYGWNYREGYIQRPGSGTPPAGFNPVPPILDYPRAPSGSTNVGYSVTGGVVYRGNRIPPLAGAYVFGDYGSGNIWALRYDGSVTTQVPFWQILADPGVAAFGIDPANGDVLYADVVEGVVRRLNYTMLSGAPLPPTLADTGAFSDLATLTPQPGIVPYGVNVPQWADDALATRWFSIPNTNSRITFRATLPWTSPVTTIWIQHFDLELTNGVPASRQRLETRFLVRSTATYGLSYRWDDSQTNAVLVPEAGLDESFVVTLGSTTRTQVWHYPGRSECMQCHVAPLNSALGFNTVQLNRDFDYGGVVDNQLRALNNAGYFTQSTSPTNLYALRALVPLGDAAHSAEQRVRSYLASHCLSCHQSGSFDTRIVTPLSSTRLVNGVLTNNLGDADNRVVTPGAPANSMLLTRLTTNGPLKMPPFSSTLPDTQAVSLVQYWITNDLVSYQRFPDWQVHFFGATNLPDAQAVADPDGDFAWNGLEHLTGTHPTNSAEAWRIALEPTISQAQVVYPRIANRGFEVQWTTKLQSSNSWQFLNVPENRPFFSASNGIWRVTDSISNWPSRYYRVRVYEP